MSGVSMLGKPETIGIEKRRVMGYVATMQPDDSVELEIRLHYPAGSVVPDIMGKNDTAISDMLAGGLVKQATVSVSSRVDGIESEESKRAQAWVEQTAHAALRDKVMAAIEGLIQRNNILSVVNPTTEMITSVHRATPYSNYVVDTWNVRDGDPRKAEKVGSTAEYLDALEILIRTAERIASLADVMGGNEVGKEEEGDTE